MIDRSRAFALLLAATLLILGAGAHAVMGWTFVREALEALPAKAGLMGVLSAGWQLGSVSLLAFGLLALVAGLACWRRQPVAPATVWIVAAALVGFGTGALLLGDGSFFYLYFGYILIGGLLALGVAPRAEGGSR
ncbi:MAG TPA: hypothetical protein VJK71_05815 [Gemmatimonadales bacterium]|nr:hypothetical protein [Gemmatimonadales bacterium]